MQGVPARIASIVGFISALCSLQKLGGDSIWEKWVYPALTVSILVGCFVFVLWIIFKHYADDLNNQEEQMSRVLSELREQQEEEMLKKGTELLEVLNREVQVVSVHPGVEELVTESIVRGLPYQMVSIRVDSRWDTVSHKITIGLGVIIETNDQFSIVKVKKKIEKYRHEWEQLLNANNEFHKEQMTHTTITEAISINMFEEYKNENIDDR